MPTALPDLYTYLYLTLLSRLIMPPRAQLTNLKEK
jgi:hypothetical protein